MIFNLLDNALKYSSREPVIQVHLSGNENNIDFTISDNGIGIDPAYKDKIFEKFFRVPHGDTHNAKGHGLGLSYVAQVVKKHNGTINYHSKPGDGTKFIIILPKQPI
jgi:signal transduction histidine kinase